MSVRIAPAAFAAVWLVAGIGAAEAANLGPKSGAYQSHLHKDCSVGTCTLTFPQIPSGKVLRLEHIGCFASVAPGTLIYLVTVQSTASNDAVLPLRPVLVASVTNLLPFDTWAATESVVHYLSPLSKPTVTIYFNQANDSADCTLTGALVTP